MAVFPLKYIARLRLSQLVVSHSLENPATRQQCFRLLAQLDEGAWGAESKAILDRVVKFYSTSLTPQVLCALLPAQSKDVCLSSCPLVTEACLNQLIGKCTQLQSLDLSNNSGLTLTCVDLFSDLAPSRLTHLTSVNLEDCTSVKDAQVQTLILNCPCLQRLNIARCDITDSVFLIDENKQLAREASFELPAAMARYDSHLQHVDVSRCSGFSSTGVRHLCTLCGPSLRCVNLCWTKIDCTALLYLSGYGLPSVVQFYLSCNILGQDTIDALLHTLEDFNSVVANVKSRWNLDETPGGCGVGERSHLDVDGDKAHLDVDEPSKDSISSLPEHASTEVGDASPAADSDSSAAHVVPAPVLSALEDSSFIPDKRGASETSKALMGPGRVSLVQTDGMCSGDQDSCLQPSADEDSVLCEASIVCEFDSDQASAESSQGNTQELHKTPPETSKEASVRLNGSDSDDVSQGFFSPDLCELSVNGVVFKEDLVGLRCFQTFILSNSRLAVLRLFGGNTYNYVTDSVLSLIGQHCRNLTSLSLQGCDKVTDIGLIGLDKCELLTKVDFTGLAFIQNPGILHLLSNRCLTHMLLPEAQVTNIGLRIISRKPEMSKLQELDLSWCEDIEDDLQLNSLVQACPSLQQLRLRVCPLTATTMEHIAHSCSHLTELSIASNMNTVYDESVICLAQHLPLLEIIDLGWNSHLSNDAINCLLRNCPKLTTAHFEGLKKITSAPFLDIIAVPDTLLTYLEERAGSMALVVEDIEVEEVPALPHRSSVHCTELRELHLNYSDLVEDHHLEEIVTVCLGSLQVVNYYGEAVEEDFYALKKFLNNLLSGVRG